MEETFTPVLQLVHISDLHVKAITADPTAPLNRTALGLLRHIQRKNLFGWEEGIRGHFVSAPSAFARFLTRLKECDTQWSDIPTWLIDTGDRTTFGDHDSIAAGERYLKNWAEALGKCEYRSLYGNHDAWPGTLPFLAPLRINGQRLHVQKQHGWAPQEWIDRPLRIDLDDGGAIELFAADTVCWGGKQNTQAVGTLEETSLASIQAKLANRTGAKSLRILATHHPLTFPWQPAEISVGGVDKMRLLNDEACARRFSNEGPRLEGLGPWFHLFLSGHTHHAHPGHGLSGEVGAIRQAKLGDYQLQLVGGPLMLNQPHIDSSARPEVAGFSPATVDSASCQAQILRFYASSTQPIIRVMRLGVYSLDGGVTYAIAPPATGVLTLCYDTP